MRKIYLFGILFLAFVLVASSVSVSAVNCRYYTSCWDKPGTKDTCCRVVAICDNGVDVWVGCTDVGSVVSPPSDDSGETIWTTIVHVEHEKAHATPPIGHVDHGKAWAAPPFDKTFWNSTWIGHTGHVDHGKSIGHIGHVDHGKGEISRGEGNPWMGDIASRQKESKADTHLVEEIELAVEKVYKA